MCTLLSVLHDNILRPVVCSMPMWQCALQPAGTHAPFCPFVIPLCFHHCIAHLLNLHSASMCKRHTPYFIIPAPTLSAQYQLGGPRKPRSRKARRRRNAGACPQRTDPRTQVPMFIDDVAVECWHDFLTRSAAGPPPLAPPRRSAHDRPNIGPKCRICWPFRRNRQLSE